MLHQSVSLAKKGIGVLFVSTCRGGKVEKKKTCLAMWTVKYATWIAERLQNKTESACNDDRKRFTRKGRAWYQAARSVLFQIFALLAGLVTRMSPFLGNYTLTFSNEEEGRKEKRSIKFIN